MSSSNAVERSALLSLVLLTAAFSAHAGEDAKRWSGAMCSPYGNTPSTDYAVRAEGIQNNTSDQSKWVVCALTRDSETAFNPQGSAVIVIRGTRPVWGSVDCMLTKGNASMGPMVTTVQAAPAAIGDWILLFSSEDMYFNITSTISLTCRLPPKAQLAHIQYSEYGGVNNP